ncbi:MAG: hypothetical protein SOV90_09030, partial [Lachnospiraceae bacterium]|nr:hypothetical protein [Lachnospiraceae bacterium]
LTSSVLFVCEVSDEEVSELELLFFELSEELLFELSFVKLLFVELSEIEVPYSDDLLSELFVCLLLELLLILEIFVCIVLLMEI